MVGLTANTTKVIKILKQFISIFVFIFALIVGGCDSSGESGCVLDNDPPSIDLKTPVDAYNVEDVVEITISGSDPNGDSIDIRWDFNQPSESNITADEIIGLFTDPWRPPYEDRTISFIPSVPGQYTLEAMGEDFEDTGSCKSRDSDKVTVSVID